MDLIYVKKLIKLLSESAVDEIEIEEEGKKIRIVKRGGTPVFIPQVTGAAPASVNQGIIPPALPLQQGSNSNLADFPANPAPADPSKYQEIKSPIVGTFYRSPAPDAAPFIQIGSIVAPGTVLCIVEAMKLMNEIESDTSGKIVKIMVENGQPVEYDQPLFLVETA